MINRLPHRPALLPTLAVLSRDRGTVQFGVEPLLLLTDLPPSVVPLLTRLDGRWTLAELLELAGPDRDDLVRLLGSLAATGLLDTERGTADVSRGHLAADRSCWALRVGPEGVGEVRAREDTSVEVCGTGRLAPRLVQALATAGIGRLRGTSRGVVRGEDLGTGYTESDVGRSRGDALTDLIDRGGADRLPRNRAADLVVLTDEPVVDPLLVNRLLIEGTPHLPVSVRDDVGVLGPLVLPGRSSCLRCTDLHRTDADPSWPRVAAQLVGQARSADLACVETTAGLATAQILLAVGAWRHEQPPPTWNTTLEIDAHRATVIRKYWSPHPGCACGAAVDRRRVS